MLRKLLFLLLRLYQVSLSPLLGPSCRFTPTCSSYAIQALKKYSILKALALVGWRLLKCHPFHPGGYDPI